MKMWMNKDRSRGVNIDMVSSWNYHKEDKKIRLYMLSDNHTHDFIGDDAENLYKILSSEKQVI